MALPRGGIGGRPGARRRSPGLGLGCLLAMVASVPTASAMMVGSVDFHACELGHAPQVASAQCATISVAEDAAHPEGRRIDLAVAWIPARRNRPRPDVVVYLAGGPGQSARDVYPQIAGALGPINRDRALLLVDQRGTGGSNALPCAVEDWRSGDEPAVQAGLVSGCLTDARRHADPRFYTTSDYVEDLETVRRSLGSPLFDVIGGSYGTRVGLELLRRRPATVRSVVLDGVVPPELALPDVLGANLDAAIDRVFADCIADPVCQARFGNPRTTLDRLRTSLAEHPQSTKLRDPHTGVENEFSLTADLVSAALRFLAYQPETATLIPLLLDQAERGYPQPLAAQLEESLDTISAELAAGMGFSVVCAEDVPIMPAVPDDPSRPGEALRQEYRRACETWPRGAMPADFHAPVVSDKPVLLLSGEYDPVTPPAYAMQVARSLSNSRSLVGLGQGHLQIFRGCTPKLVADFVETLDTKVLDARCLDALRPQPIFLSPAGPAP